MVGVGKAMLVEGNDREEPDSDSSRWISLSCGFFIFAGCPLVSEGSSDVSNVNDLFDLSDIRVATVDVVTHSSDGSQEGLVGSGVIREGDGCLCSSEWCTNGGTTMWNC